MISRLLAASALALALPAHSVILSVSPANPTPADTLVLEVRDAAPCASIVPGTAEMTDGRVIRVRWNDGTNVLCIAAMSTPRVTLGRLPAGDYRVELVPFPGGSGGVAVSAFSVRISAGGPDDPPLDDYSGHYLTDRENEGVFVAQSGRTAFISYLYIDADGKPGWAVMPDARWGLAPNGGLRFFGQIWRIEGPGVPGGTGRLIAMIGFGSFFPSGIHDQARIETHIPQMQVRSLARFRF